MIDWRPIADLPDEMLDGREVLLAVANTLGTANGGDGVMLNPRHPWLRYIATWAPSRGREGGWETTEDDGGGDCHCLGRDEPRYFAELTAPETLHIFRQSGGQIAEALSLMRQHGQPLPGEEPWRFRDR